MHVCECVFCTQTPLHLHKHLFIDVPVCFQAAKVAEEKQNSPSGINHYHTTFLLIIQIGFVIVWALYVQVPKCLCMQLETRVHLCSPARVYNAVKRAVHTNATASIAVDAID